MINVFSWKNIKLHTIAFFLFMCGVFTFSDKTSTIWIFYIFALFYVAVGMMYLLQKRFVVICDRWIKINLIFILWMLLSVFWQYSTEIYVQRIITITIIVFFCFMTSQFVKGKEELYTLIKSVVWANVVNCIYRLLSGGLLQVLGKYESDEILVVGANNLAMMVVITFVFSVYCYRQSTNVIYLGTSALFLIVALMTGSRKALIGIALVLVVQYIIKDKHYIKNTIIAGLMLMVFVIIFTQVEMFEYTWERFQRMLAYAEGKSSVDSSISVRMEYIKVGFKSFSQRPVLGYGVGYSYTNLTGSAHTYLHNNYLELAVSLGMIGLLVYYAQYFLIVIRTFRNKISNNSKATIITLLITFFFVFDIGAVTYFEKYALIALHLLYMMTRYMES